MREEDFSVPAVADPILPDQPSPSAAEVEERVATAIAFAMGWNYATPQSRHYARFAIRAMMPPKSPLTGIEEKT